MRVYTYWTGRRSNLIRLLHTIGRLRTNLEILTPASVRKMIRLPRNFHKLLPAHQADVVRVLVLEKYGGIWIDSDTIVLDTLVPRLMSADDDGFFVSENVTPKGRVRLCFAVFGSKPHTPLMRTWRKYVVESVERANFETKKYPIGWTQLGTKFLNRYLWGRDRASNLFRNYRIYDGRSTMYPVPWNEAREAWIDDATSSWTHLKRDFQPLIVLCKEVHRDRRVRDDIDALLTKKIEKMSPLIHALRDAIRPIVRKRSS